MKSRQTQAKYRLKAGCGCKLCKPQKGGHEDRRTIRDIRLAVSYQQQLADQ